MAIRIRHGSLTIEVDSDDDLRTVLRVAGEGQLPLPGVGVAVPNNGAEPEPPVGAEPTEALCRRLWATITNPRTQAYVNILAAYPNGATDTELRQQLSLDSNSKLAARTTQVVRACRRLGIDDARLLIRRREGQIGEWTYYYELAPVMRDVVNAPGGGRPR